MRHLRKLDFRCNAKRRTMFRRSPRKPALDECPIHGRERYKSVEKGPIRRTGTLSLVEQPEIHLYPQVQSELADAFICAVKAREKNVPGNVQLIVESHSEHFLNRLQRRVAEGAVQPAEVAIYFCHRTESGTELSGKFGAGM